MKKIILNGQTRVIPEKSLEHPDYHPPKKPTHSPDYNEGYDFWVEPVDEEVWDDDPNPYSGTYSEE